MLFHERKPLKLRALETLDQQAEYLRAGSIEHALALSGKLQGIVQEISSSPDKSDLQMIVRKAQRNAELIGAARDGIAAAQKLINPPKEKRFSVYTAKGEQVSL